MNQRELLRLICKSFGLYFILESALNAKQIIYYATGITFLGKNNISLYYYLGQNIFDLVVYGLGAWILINKSEFISNKLANASSDQLQLMTTKADLIEIVIIGIGVLFIINAIPEILNKLTHYLYFNEYGRANKNLFWDEKDRKTEIIYSTFKFAVGLLTITNGRLVARRLTKIGDKDEELEKK
jgi:hypothetical protein